MPKDEQSGAGVSRTFYIDKDVSDKIDAASEKLDRTPSKIANRLLKQALVCPKWNWPGERWED